ncbi:MAG: hypothetical protein K0U74_06850 [Alphaproteobacteria bacterium]|nr:hypothetical protein [Alphaproteobacteria bacterium]
MQQASRALAVLVACMVGLSGLVLSASAQDGSGDIEQIKLTEGQIVNLVAAQKDLGAVAKRLEGLPDDSEVSVKDELDAIATKHGFKDFNELDLVSANVQIVLDGIDPDTGAYEDPIVGLKEELEEVRVDKALEEDERKALVEELEEAVAALPALKFKENIELVKKHQKMIQNALDEGDGK